MTRRLVHCNGRCVGSSDDQASPECVGCRGRRWRAHNRSHAAACGHALGTESRRAPIRLTRRLMASGVNGPPRSVSNTKPPSVCRSSFGATDPRAIGAVAEPPKPARTPIAVRRECCPFPGADQPRSRCSPMFTQAGEPIFSLRKPPFQCGDHLPDGRAGWRRDGPASAFLDGARTDKGAS